MDPRDIDSDDDQGPPLFGRLPSNSSAELEANNVHVQPPLNRSDTATSRRSVAPASAYQTLPSIFAPDSPSQPPLSSPQRIMKSPRFAANSSRQTRYPHCNISSLADTALPTAEKAGDDPSVTLRRQKRQLDRHALPTTLTRLMGSFPAADASDTAPGPFQSSAYEGNPNLLQQQSGSFIHVRQHVLT